MRLIKPSYKILHPERLKEALVEIEEAARICYKSEGLIKEGSAELLVKKIMERGHTAMIEFGPSISVVLTCDRGVSHEIVRHRLCSFAQESTRYCNYSKEKFSNQLTFVIPPWLPDVLPTDNASIEVDNASLETIGACPNLGWERWLFSLQVAEKMYLSMVNQLNPKTGKPDKRFRKWKPEEARSVLPNSLKTEIVVKADIREWVHIFSLRADGFAHPQMRELMIPLLKEFQTLCPTIFNHVK